MSNPLDYSFSHIFSSSVFRIKIIVLMKKPTNTRRMNKYQWSGWPYILPMIKDKTAPKSTAIHTSIRITTSPFLPDRLDGGATLFHYYYPSTGNVCRRSTCFFIIWTFKFFIRCTFLLSLHTLAMKEIRPALPYKLCGEYTFGHAAND